MRKPQQRRRTPPSPYSRRSSGFTLIEILIVIIILGILAAIAIFAVGVYNGDGNNNQNTDPRVGWVSVNRHLEKRCDGSTMLYHDKWDDNYHVAANAPECAE